MRSVLFVLTASFLLSNTNSLASNSDPTKKAMLEVGMNLDSAEAALRVVLNKPASGVLPDQMRSCEAKLEAAMTLLNFEQRHPGYLQGKHGKIEWAQYNSVRKLYEEAASKFDFYFPAVNKEAPKKAGSAVVR